MDGKFYPETFSTNILKNCPSISDLSLALLIYNDLTFLFAHLIRPSSLSNPSYCNTAAFKIYQRIVLTKFFFYFSISSPPIPVSLNPRLLDIAIT